MADYFALLCALNEVNRALIRDGIPAGERTEILTEHGLDLARENEILRAELKRAREESHGN